MQYDLFSCEEMLCNNVSSQPEKVLLHEPQCNNIIEGGIIFWRRGACVILTHLRLTYVYRSSQIYNEENPIIVRSCIITIIGRKGRPNYISNRATYDEPKFNNWKDICPNESNSEVLPREI